MFLLFVNLYMAMFTGTWNNMTWDSFHLTLKKLLNGVGTFLTSIFGDNTMTTLGDVLAPTSSNNVGYLNQSFIVLIATILATITSIGIVVMAVKGVKKAFGIFFMGLR